MARKRNYQREEARRKELRAQRLAAAGLPYMGRRAEQKLRQERGQKRAKGRGSVGYYGPAPMPSSPVLSARYVNPAQVERMNRDNMKHLAAEARRIANLRNSSSGDKETDLHVAMAKYVNFYDTRIGDRVGDYSEERVAYVTDYYSAVTSVAKNEVSYRQAKRSGASRALVRKALADHRQWLDKEYGSDLVDIFDAGYKED